MRFMAGISILWQELRLFLLHENSNPVYNIMKRMIQRSALGFATAAALSTTAGAAITSIPVSGWTHDLVINGSGPYNTSITNSMDNETGIENWTWVEEGNYLFQAETTPSFFEGLVAGTHTSIGPSGAEFTFQDFSGLNALRLSATQSSTLTLTTTSAYSTLVFIGAAGNGSSAAIQVTLNFADSTTAVFNSTEGISRDWFDGTSTESAYLVGGRASNRSEDSYSALFRDTNSAIRLHEYQIFLSEADQGKELTSITLSNTGSGGRIAVFAVSGEAIPEPSTAGLVALCGLFGLGHRRRRR